jgi:hypothetical protein
LKDTKIVGLEEPVRTGAQCLKEWDSSTNTGVEFITVVMAGSMLKRNRVRAHPGCKIVGAGRAWRTITANVKKWG